MIKLASRIGTELIWSGAVRDGAAVVSTTLMAHHAVGKRLPMPQKFPRDTSLRFILANAFEQCIWLSSSNACDEAGIPKCTQLSNLFLEAHALQSCRARRSYRTYAAR